MRENKLFFVAIVMLILDNFANAQSPNSTIEGIYRQDGTPVALQIKQLSGSDYFINMVLMKADGKIVPIKGQSGLLAYDIDRNIMFYWQTGSYEDIPGSSTLIVYKMMYDGLEQLSGTYYFSRNSQLLGQ